MDQLTIFGYSFNLFENLLSFGLGSIVTIGVGLVIQNIRVKTKIQEQSGDNSQNIKGDGNMLAGRDNITTHNVTYANIT